MKDTEIFLLHSRFPFAQRDRLEKKVIEKFGESDGNARPEKSVLVATQIIEQSLDLDFDFMISDLAPVDLLIQRAGRIQRHERTRPVTMKNPVLYVSLPEKDINSIEGLKRAGPVYDPYILLKTYLLLKDMDKIRIPEDINRLIEDVYEFELTDKKYENFLEQLKEEMLALEKHNKLKAELPLILSPIKDIEMIIEQKNERFSDEDNPAIYQSLKAKTRDAPPSLSVVCLHEIDQRLYPELVHTDRQTPVNIEALPNYEVTKILLKSSIRISNRYLFNQLMKIDSPEAWKKNHYLKHSRLLVFNNNKCIFNNISLKLDQEMGLIINYSNNDGEENNEF
jgi:CRISPR-associated endonuclease/helicase Cas3